MIARGGSSEPTKGQDLWAQVSAEIPADRIKWRLNSKPFERNGKFYCRCVAYIEAETVRHRLDAVFPGEWDLTLEVLPVIATEANEGPTYNFKARLQILGVLREDVGQGASYKNAATDAFKRAAVRFGIGHELADYPQPYVQVDSGGKFPKMVESIEDALARVRGAQGTRPQSAERPAGASVPTGKGGKVSDAIASGPGVSQGQQQANKTDPSVIIPWKGFEVTASPAEIKRKLGTPSLLHSRFQYQANWCVPACPTCQGMMYDNREKKLRGMYAAKAPDFQCMDRSCADQKGKFWSDEFQSAFARGTVSWMFIDRGEKGRPVIFYPEDRVEDIAEASKRGRDERDGIGDFLPDDDDGPGY